MNSEALRCAVIALDDGFRAAAVAALRAPGSHAEIVLEERAEGSALSDDLAGRLLSVSPAIIVLGLEHPERAIPAIQKLSEDAPRRLLALSGPRIGPDLLLELIRAGATEYLPQPVNGEELAAAVLRLERRLGRQSMQTRRDSSRLLTVSSAKGGTGATTIATNLAIALRQGTKARVLLLDMHPHLGTAAVHLGTNPRFSFMDLVQNFHRLDEGLLESFIEHHASGLDLLASPATDVHRVATAEEATAILEFLRCHFDFIVADTGTDASPASLTVQDAAANLLVVTTAELPALRNTKRLLQHVVVHGQEGRVRVIVNRYHSSDPFSVHDIREALGHPVHRVLARDDRAVTMSLNVGKPAILGSTGAFVKDVRQLAADLVQMRNEPAVPARGFRKLFGNRKAPKSAVARITAFAEEGIPS